MATTTSSSSSKICYNTECNELKSEIPKKGWLLRTGEFAELCDRCGSAFEEGRFCETFHLNAPGWRNCETCRKQIHCGCIVSSNSFMLLDPGGVECIACARKNIILPSNLPWPQSYSLQSRFSKKLRDLSARNWNQLAGSGPVPWKQAPSLFNSVSSPDLHPDVPSVVELSTNVDKIYHNERLPASSLEKKNEDLSGLLVSGSIKHGAPEMMLMNGMRNEEKSSSCLNMCQQPSSLKQDSLTQQFGLPLPYICPNEKNAQAGLAGSHPQQTPPHPGKQCSGTVHIPLDSSGENQPRSGKPRADARGRNQLLPRNWPRWTDQDLQQISLDSNSVITPLFQKTLSASDAGRIGRLVLPKKCAEAYFPPISQPEGLPLRILDAKGKEWIFQFRFWPNNNSRMYVLEGVTPCIQSMQLQAGDTVTFSRLEPEGRLVMGFRKASSATSDQDNETTKIGNGFSAHTEVELADPCTWSKVDKSGYIAKEVLGRKSSISRKRKTSTLGLKSKRLRFEHEDLIEVKITWEEAQGLLRPPPNHVPSIVVIEGFEFEEYEDAPVLGKPTIFMTDNVGEKIQWAQCEDCLKWRKLPASALLPPKWTCSHNIWDQERSSCLAAQEPTAEQLENFLPSCKTAFSKKMKAAKQDPDNVEALEGLDTLANLAILGEGEALPASSQATTKHPRHRPGCSCIVCIQPPSGKGPKHKQTCTCNVCLTVKRRFRTLMLRREKKQSDREAETIRRKQEQQQPQPLPSSEILLDDDSLPCSNMGDSSPNQDREGDDGSDDDPNRTKSSASPFKGQIDLNIQPEREEELSPGSDSGGMMKLLHDATERYLCQQIMNSGAEDTLASQSQKVGGGVKEEKLSNGGALGDGDHVADKEHAHDLSMNV